MPQDRANQPLKKGDLVTFVYGGDLHTATVVGFDVDPVTKLDRAVLEATLYIPTATVHALDKADTKPEPLPTGVAKNPGGYDETQPDAAHTLSPETAVQVHRDEIERAQKEREKQERKGEEPAKGPGDGEQPPTTPERRGEEKHAPSVTLHTAHAGGKTPEKPPQKGHSK